MLIINLTAFIIFICYADCVPPSKMIKHGDEVSFMYMCVANDTGAVYNYASVMKYDGISTLKKLKCSREATFVIYKEPYYKSPNDVVLTGYGIRLEIKEARSRKGRPLAECTIQYKSRKLVCKPGKPRLFTGLRLMDKHGRDKAQLINHAFVKFRSVGSAVDCNGNVNTAMQCKKKSVRPDEYGFVIYKRI